MRQSKQHKGLRVLGPGLLLALGLLLLCSCQRSQSTARHHKIARKGAKAISHTLPTPRQLMPASAQAPRPSLRSVLIKGVPHVKQKPDFCGEACAEMYLRKLGHKIDQDDIFARCKVSPVKGRGCVARELVRALKKTGFRVGRVWYNIAVNRASAELGAQFRALHKDLAAGIPSIVCMHYDNQPQTTEHFRLILGYDKAKDEVIYHEPAVARGGYKRMKRTMFLKLWPLKYEKKTWTAIRMRLQPGTIKPAKKPQGHSPADYAQHIMKLKKKLPKGFTIVLQKPFVVIGDESPMRVLQRAQGTVRWSVTNLKKLYFKRDPTHILNIWLFKDKRSYLKHNMKFFGTHPGTPYGYYSSAHKVLVMNIATGGGTLVHEIVHPFVEANFKGYKAWFNEGLGSLYEQCGQRNGRMVGFTNWRLAGLQQAIRAGKVPSFSSLMNTTEHQFYNEDPGTNYSQSRYLLYYLQEKGVLVRYYHAYYKNRRKDPTGWKTLRKLLKIKNPKRFQKKWEQWVLKLRYPA